MKYIVTVEGATHEVTIEQGRVAVDGVEYQLDFRQVGLLPLYSVLVDGRSCAATVELTGRGQYRVLLEGELYFVSVRAAGARLAKALASLQSSDGTVRAPMPGMVTSVSVVAGQEVGAGERLLTLESMKMENPITAPIAGVVRKVYVQQGQIVEPGQPLVTIELRAGYNTDSDIPQGAN
jgi:biotin carboxyl carrier protein